MKKVASTDQLGRLIKLSGNAIDLVREGKRDEQQTKELLTALQLFKDPNSRKPSMFSVMTEQGSKTLVECMKCHYLVDENDMIWLPNKPRFNWLAVSDEAEEKDWKAERKPVTCKFCVQSDNLPDDSLVVDYSKKPDIKELEVVEHPDYTGIISINLSKIERKRIVSHKGNTVSGIVALKSFKAKGIKLLDVRVLDELMKRPELIPADWKRKGSIYFGGTIFRGRGLGGGLCIVGIFWSGRCDCWISRVLTLEEYSGESMACLKA